MRDVTTKYMGPKIYNNDANENYKHFLKMQIHLLLLIQPCINNTMIK